LEDQWGTTADFYVPETNTAYLLFTQEDYTYGTRGYETVTGTQDLTMYEQVRIKLLERSGYQVKTISSGNVTSLEKNL
jgi:hypothetical protein